MAYPQAVSIVKACVDTAMQLGLPEAQLPLAQAAILLATAPKSNSVTAGIGRAWADVRAGRTGDVPRELQNVHADSAGMEQGAGLPVPPRLSPPLGTAAVSARCPEGCPLLRIRR